MHYALTAIPEGWRQNGNDLIWTAAVAAAVTALVTIVWRIEPLRKFPRWFWRHSWGKDFQDGQVVWNTPVRRVKRWMVEAMAPALAKQDLIMADNLEAFRDENSLQHSVVAGEIAALKERLAAVEAAVALMTKGN